MIFFFATIFPLLLVASAIFFIIKTSDKELRRAYSLSIIAGSIALAIRWIIVLFIHIPRPNPDFGKDSFPSGHASFLFGMGWYIFFFNRPLGAIFLSGALLNSLFRVIANYHYPIDIIGGLVLGFIIAFFLKYAIKK